MSQDNKEQTYSRAFMDALATVEHMAPQPVALLPLEPSLIMVAEGARAGHVSRRTARMIYRAMARAALL